MADTSPHPVTEIRGIGEALATSLESRGVSFDIDLLQQPATHEAARLEDVDGLSEDGLLEQILPQARLLRLPGIDGAIAAALVSGGYRWYSELMMADTGDLIRRLIEEEAIDGPAPDERDVLRWQLEAARRSKSGTLYLRTVHDESGEPVAGATATILGDGHTDVVQPIRRLTDPRGVAFFERLAATDHTVTVTADGFLPSTGTFDVSSQGHTTLRFSMTPGEAQADRESEFDGDVVFISPGMAVVNVAIPYRELDPLPPVVIERLSSSGATLASLWRYREGDAVWIPTHTADLEDLPASIEVGMVLTPGADGSLEIAEGLTVSEYRRRFVSERMASGGGS